MTSENMSQVETSLSGYELLNEPLLNKGTAFTEGEREEFDLHGLLPPHVSQLDYQVQRRLEAFRGLHTDMQRYTFLRGLQDSNEVLFYAMLTRNIEEMMPIVYTPTVGLGCQLFSHIFRKLPPVESLNGKRYAELIALELPEIAPAEAERQPLVVDAQQV